MNIQGIKQKRLRVRGLIQIPGNTETTSALLIRKYGDYYLHVTVFQKKQATSNTNPKKISTVGIDYGIRNLLTLSNGIRINYEVPLTARVKHLQRELAGRKRFSKNWLKTRDRLEKEQDKLVNRKKDIRSKLIHKLVDSRCE